ncbi:MAG: universal stress protein [Bacteroidota bacterium]
MEPIKKILVGLDMSEMDDTLIEFASFVTKSSLADHIYFVNVIKNIEIPQELKQEFPNMVPNALDERKKQIESKIEDHFTAHSDIQSHVIVEKGQPSKVILGFAKKEGIDIIIMGNKTKLKGSGVLSQRLARRASCMLLIIPEGLQPTMERLLVPIDFSEYSKLALEYAIYISRNNMNKVEVICQNVYNVPVGYHYTGKSFEEFAGVMKRNAEKTFDNFIKEIDTEGVKITAVYSLDQNDDLTSDIRDLADELKISGLIVGAKGRSATTAIFLGSMAEKLLQVVDKYPLTVVRPKGKTAGILEALMEI